MQKFQYITVDTILAKYSRDFKGNSINESDAIEWIGEALGFMKVASASEEAVAFLEVKDYVAPIPIGLHYIIQIGKDNQWTANDSTNVCTVNQLLCELDPLPCTKSTCDDGCTSGCGCHSCNPPIVTDCQGNLIGPYDFAYYRPKFDLHWEYDPFYRSMKYSHRYSPVRLANNSFYNSLVCHVEEWECLDGACRDEYTIVQNFLKFNFKEGMVAVAYKRQMIDQITGYPMVPDDESAKAAITYYLGWKMKEAEMWNHREGAVGLAERAEQKWLKYVKQFKSKAKMPTGVDDYQDLMEQSLYLVPRHDSYYGFFGNLNYPEDRKAVLGVRGYYGDRDIRRK